MLISKCRLNIHLGRVASLAAISQSTKTIINPYRVSLLCPSLIVGRAGLCAQMAGWESLSESGMILEEHEYLCLDEVWNQELMVTQWCWDWSAAVHRPWIKKLQANLGTAVGTCSHIGCHIKEIATALWWNWSRACLGGSIITPTDWLSWSLFKPMYRRVCCYECIFCSLGCW